MDDLTRALTQKNVYDRAYRKDAEMTQAVSAVLHEIECGDYRRGAQAAACLMLALCVKAGMKPFTVLRRYYGKV